MQRSTDGKFWNELHGRGELQNGFLRTHHSQLESIISTSFVPLRSFGAAFLLSLSGAFVALLQGCGTSAYFNPTPEPLEITTPSPLPSATIGTAYSAMLAATGGTIPYAWSISAGTSPNGLTLSSAGVLSGTPTASGPVSFTVKVTDAGAQTATAPLQITIAPAALQITTTSPLPSGQVRVAYSTSLIATGGTTPYTWSISAGAPPNGLTLSSTGVLSGTPTVEVTEVEVIGDIQQDSVDETEVAVIPPRLAFSTGSWRQRGKFDWKRRVLVSGCHTPISGARLRRIPLRRLTLFLVDV